MNTAGVIALGIGAAGVAAGFAYLASRKAAAAGQPSPCEQIAAGGVALYTEGKTDGQALAKIGCSLLGAVAELFKGTDQRNAELNGPPVRSVPRAVYDRMLTRRDSLGDVQTQERHWGSGDVHNGSLLVKGLTLEYQNGCVPWRNHAGWAKCKPGTGVLHWPESDNARHAFEGWADGSDPFTTRMTDIEAKYFFPSGVPAGQQAWWHRGEAKLGPKCADGQLPWNPDGQWPYACRTPASKPTSEPRTRATYAPSDAVASRDLGGGGDPAPAGYHYVCVNGVCHLERDRAA